MHPLSPFPKGAIAKFPRPLFWQPGYLPKETLSFARPPRDGFAFLAEHPKRGEVRPRDM